jgi:hypothetical protein
MRLQLDHQTSYPSFNKLLDAPEIHGALDGRLISFGNVVRHGLAEQIGIPGGKLESSQEQQHRTCAMPLRSRRK